MNGEEINPITTGHTAAIYLLAYLDTKDELTRYQMGKKLGLRQNNFYEGKDEKKVFSLLESKGYVKEIGRSERDEPIYQSTPLGIIDEIEKKLKEKKHELTSFEKEILNIVFDDIATRKIVKKFLKVEGYECFGGSDQIEVRFLKKYLDDRSKISYAKGQIKKINKSDAKLLIKLEIAEKTNLKEKREIDSFNIIFEKRIITFIVMTYISKNILGNAENTIYESENIDDFKKAWDGFNKIFNEKEDLLLQLGFPTAKHWTGEFSKRFLPDEFRSELFKDFSIIPSDPNFYMKWGAIPNNLAYKLMLISDEAKALLSVYTLAAGRLIPYIVLGTIEKRYIDNIEMRKYLLYIRMQVDKLNKQRKALYK